MKIWSLDRFIDYEGEIHYGLWNKKPSAEHINAVNPSLTDKQIQRLLDTGECDYGGDCVILSENEVMEI